MKRGIQIAAFISALFLGNATVQAQAGLKKSNKEYDRWAYIESASIYEKVLKRGYTSQDLLEKLGNTYYFNARYAEAQPYYERLFTEIEPQQIVDEETGETTTIPVEIASEYYYRYAQTLQHVGRSAEAKKYYDLFVSKVGNDTQIAQFRKNEAELQEQITANSGRYSNIANLPVNTPYADYGSFVRNNELYFTSARDTGSLAKKVHTWTGEAFTSLYRYELENANDSLAKPNKVHRLKGEVKSKLNEATAVITKDGQTMYFTRNNMLGNTRGYDEDKNTKLKIYRATLNEKGKWDNVEELPFNSDDFNTAHPVLSSDERMMYFVSDRPGGFGSSDIWRIAIHDNGTFGGPENAGPAINTEARETFPFLTQNDELYFSSNGRVGLGGLDIYAVQTKKDGSFGEVQNIGAPVNSSADDFAYYIDEQTKTGFFSSNREGGIGNDDIYSFVENQPLQLECVQDLIVTVIDAKTKNVISDATLELSDWYYKALSKGSNYDPETSTYQMDAEIDCGQSYRIKAQKDGYTAAETDFYVSSKSGQTYVTLMLEPERIPVKKGDDLFKVLDLNPIYFDLDKSNIRPDAAAELAKVLAVLEEYPTMKIDIRSHTDSRASMAYNDKLSERRAQSTRQWLIDQGIEASRLTAKGYGERQLINQCADGVNCTEEEHQANRRSEFIIVELN